MSAMFYCMAFANSILDALERYAGRDCVWRRRADSVFDGVRGVADVVVVRVFVYETEPKVG